MFSRITMISLLVLGASAAIVTADDKADANELTAWTNRRIEEMRAYQVTLNTVTERRVLELQELPLLQWSNPVRGDYKRGSLFLWTTGGIPQLACSTYPYPKPTITTHEFQSLADAPITLSAPETGSHALEPSPVALRPLSGAPLPASSRPLRLAQMRKLAGRFSAQVDDVATGDDKARLLTQPIYRYPQDAEPDGAIFVLSQGTDPECLIVLEATEEGWHYRVARMTAIQLTVRLDDRVIKEFPKVWVVKDPSYQALRIDAP